MNISDIDIIKESVIEYCENIYGQCLGYMKKNNINHDLSGLDDLTILLRLVDDIQNSVRNISDIEEINDYRDKVQTLSWKIRSIIG